MRKRIKKLFANKCNDNKVDSDTLSTDRKIITFPYIKMFSETVAAAINKEEFLIGYRHLKRDVLID